MILRGIFSWLEYIVHPNFYYYEVYVEENAEAKSYCMFIQHVCHEGL